MSSVYPNWPFPPLNKIPRSWHYSSTFTIAAVGVASKLWIEWLNKTKIHNRDQLEKVVDDRKPGQPLVTVSNHESCLDDPVLWGLLNWKHVIGGRWKMRHTAAASDICFTKKWHSIFFALGQTVPIVRGEGVYQHGMDYLVEILSRGGWVHTFPEGKVNMQKEEMRLKWGVGRLIADSKKPPVVLPMWHKGIDSILPNSSPYIPRIKKKVTLVVGDPMDFTGMLEKLREANSSPMKIRKQVTDAIQEEFKSLKDRAETLHIDNLHR